MYQSVQELELAQGVAREPMPLTSAIAIVKPGLRETQRATTLPPDPIGWLATTTRSRGGVVSTLTQDTSREPVSFSARRVAVALLGACLVMGALASGSAALPSGPAGRGGDSCPPGVSVGASASLREHGTAAIGRTITFDASASKLFIMRNCESSFKPLPSSSWRLIAKPSNSSADLATRPGQRASMTLDRAGSYRVRFTACPKRCTVSFGGFVRTVAPKSVETVVSVVRNRPPRAALSVSLPRRAASSWSFWDTVHDTYRPGYAYLSDWRVTIDACGSSGGTDETGAPVAISSYRFRFVRLDLPAPVLPHFAPMVERTTTACRLRLGLPALGRWQVETSITTAGGRSALAHRQIRDLVVLALGDSLTSAEGNPDRDRTGGHPAVWQDRQCHRSADSWAAHAAAALENDATSVTLLDFACSGATIANIHSSGWRGEDPQSGDRPLPPQLVAAEQVLGSPDSAQTRTADVVLMSAGINDLDFGDFLIYCAHHFGGCTHGKRAVTLRDTIKLLPDRYARLGAALTGHIKAGRVNVLEYPSRLFTTSQGRTATCGAFSFHMSDGEANYMMNRGDDLNARLRAAASANHWTYLGGIRDAFLRDVHGEGHGYCAKHTWFRSYSGSKKLQGDDKGTAHPNRTGHQKIAQLVRPKLRSETVPGPVAFQPPARARAQSG